jgi:hypothetical protein
MIVVLLAEDRPNDRSSRSPEVASVMIGLWMIVLCLNFTSAGVACYLMGAFR